jgi:HEAT repeat protein
MQRKSLLVLAAVAAVGTGLYVTFPRRTGESGGGTSEARTPYPWMNDLPLATPPAAITGRGFGKDLTGRVLDRIEWGGSEVQNYSLRQLERLPDAPSRAAARVSELLATRSLDAFYAARLLEFLGRVGASDQIGVIESALESPAESMRRAAVRALRSLGTPAARDRILELTRASDPGVRNEAMSALAQVVGDPQSQLDALTLGAVDTTHVLGLIESLAAQNCRNAIPVIASHLSDSSERVRVTAAKALVMLHEPEGRGLAVLRALLRSPRLEEQTLAVEQFATAHVLPPLEDLQPLVASPSMQLRTTIAELLGSGAADAGAATQRLDLLERLADDPASRVRVTALSALYKLGRTDVALPLIDKIRSRKGGELGEAVQIVTELMKDPRALPVLRERIAVETDPHDRASLLHGLSAFADGASVQSFVGDLLRAGSESDPVISSSGDRSLGARLSAHAALKMQTLGAPAAQALLDVLARNPSTPVSLLAIDVLRGIVRRMAPDPDPALASRIAEALLGIVRSESRDGVVRQAAAESLPFFDEVARGEALAAAKGAVRNRDVLRSIDLVLWNYF